MVGVVEIRQVERVVVVVECCVMGKLGEVLDMVVLPEWRISGPHWSPKLEDVVRKVERRDVAVAMWSRDPNLGVTVCGQRRWMSCDWLWMEERGSKSWWWNGSSGGRIQV